MPENFRSWIDRAGAANDDSQVLLGQTAAKPPPLVYGAAGIQRYRRRIDRARAAPSVTTRYLSRAAFTNMD